MAAHTPRRTAVDPQPIRRRVSAILHSLDRMRPSEAYWQVGSVVNQVGEVLDQARAFVKAGDGGNALAYLEAITDEYVEGWVNLDDSDGYAGGFFGRNGSYGHDGRYLAAGIRFRARLRLGLRVWGQG